MQKKLCIVEQSTKKHFSLRSYLFRSIYSSNNSQLSLNFPFFLISLLFSALHTQILKEVLVSLKQVSIKEKSAAADLVLLSFRLFMHCKCRSKSLVMTARFPVIPNSCKKSLQKTSLKESSQQP